MASTPLPKELGQPYDLNSEYFVFRKPFLVNAALSSRASDEHHPEQSNRFETSMAARTLKPKDIFIGISGLKALDLISLTGKDTNTQYERAVLFDANERQIEGMRAVLTLIDQCETSREFIERFAPLQEKLLNPPEYGSESYGRFSQLKKSTREDYHNVFGAGYQPQTEQQTKNLLYNLAGYKPVFHPDGTVTQEPHLDGHGKPVPRENSWLQQGNYEKIRAMVKAGKIELATMDLRDNEGPQSKVKQFESWLRTNDYHVADCYVSSLTSFADPYLKYDYYGKSLSWAQEKKQTTAFYQTLLSITDKASKFIISDPSPNAPFLHSYHLHEVEPEYMQSRLDDLPEREPPSEFKKYAALFTAGGQVWRLAGFMEEDPATGAHVTKYFRIFSEGFPKDRATIDEQVKKIDQVLKDIYRKRDEINGMTFIEPGNLTLRVPMAERVDSQFFKKQMEEKGNNVVLSSKPFSIHYDPYTQKPEQALEELIFMIKDRFRREKKAIPLKIVPAETPRPPEIITRPAAIQAALERKNPAPADADKDKPASPQR